MLFNMDMWIRGLRWFTRRDLWQIADDYMKQTSKLAVAVAVAIAQVLQVPLLYQATTDPLTLSNRSSSHKPFLTASNSSRAPTSLALTADSSKQSYLNVYFPSRQPPNHDGPKIVRLFGHRSSNFTYELLWRWR